MKSTLFLFFLVVLGVSCLGGCGGEEGSPYALPTPEITLTQEDKLLSGSWQAVKLTQQGDRVLVKFSAEKWARTVVLEALKASGATAVIGQGNYTVEKNTLSFRMTLLNNPSFPFTLNEKQLTLGKDAYVRYAGKVTGPLIGGQIRLTQTAKNEAVKVSSIPDFVPGEILVKYKESGTRAALVVGEMDTPLYEKMILTPLPVPPALSVSVKSGSLLTDVERVLHTTEQLKKQTLEKIRLLREDPDVEYAVPNVLLTIQSSFDDSRYPEQWNLKSLGHSDGWDEITATQPTVVAIVDTGLVRHPDLDEKKMLWGSGCDFITQTANSLDQDGLDKDPTDPGDKRNLGFSDGNSWHGTHLAGIVAAESNNSKGIAGLAKNVQILPLRTMGYQGRGSIDDVVQAIRYAAGLSSKADGICQNKVRVDVINLSLGEALMPALAKPLNEAIDAVTQLGVVVVAAAGNTAQGKPDECLDIDPQNSGALMKVKNAACDFFPAANPNVLSVGAVYPNLAFASSYSNQGSHQFIVAPGGAVSSGILSLIHPDVQGGYGQLAGTSQAAAHVSGMVAMMLAELSEPTRPGGAVSMTQRPVQVKDILKNSASDLGLAGRDDEYGWGLPNLCRALVTSKGSAGSQSPVLKLSSSTVRFEAYGDEHTVILRGACGGKTGPIIFQTTTKDGKDWLKTELDSKNNESLLKLKVDRSGLPAGDYSGTIRLDYENKTYEVAVSMSVIVQAGVGTENGNQLRDTINDYVAKNTTPDPSNHSNQSSSPTASSTKYNQWDAGEVVVLLVSVEDPSKSYFSFSDFSSDYRFQMSGMPPGKYYLFAGIDENKDKKICEKADNETCLGYPNYTQPEPITITESTFKQDYLLQY